METKTTITKEQPMFNLINEYTDDMNVSIQRFENSFGHGVRAFDKDANETVICTIYPTSQRADTAYAEAINSAKNAI